MAEHNPPLWLQNRTDHTAENERSLIDAVFASREGVIDSNALKVGQNGTPNMSVNVSGGRAAVFGDESANQGMYLVWNDAVTNVAIAAADPTNPRHDIIVARVRDTYYSGGTDAFDLYVVQGTPAGSPADPSIPSNALPLARVAVAAGATSITNANITDLRPRAAAIGAVIVCTSTTRPTTGLYEGMQIRETDTGLRFEYRSSAWRALSQSLRPPGCQAIRTSAMNVPTATWTAIQFNATDGWDTDNFHDTSTNNTRITIPTGLGGIYLINGIYQMSASGTGVRASRFLVNGTTTYPLTYVPGHAIYNAGTLVLPLAAGDYIEYQVYQDSGGTLTVTGTLSATFMSAS